MVERTLQTIKLFACWLFDFSLSLSFFSFSSAFPLDCRAIVVRMHTYMPYTRIHNDGCTFLNFARSFFLIRHQHNNRHIPFTAMHTRTHAHTVCTFCIQQYIKWIGYFTLAFAFNVLCGSSKPFSTILLVHSLLCARFHLCALWTLCVCFIVILQTHYMFIHANVTHSDLFSGTFLM